MKRPMGPNERRLFEHFSEHHMPTEEQRKRIASNIRASAHLMLSAARKIEGGDIMALGRMLSEPEVMRFVSLAGLSSVISRELTDAVREIDAEAN